MKKLLILAAVLQGTVLFGQSQQLVTAKELQTECTTGVRVFEAQGRASTEDAADYGKCLGYLEGMLDSMRILGESDQNGKAYKFHLKGEGLAVKDAITFFLTFIKEDREHDHDGPAAPMVIRSLEANHILTRSAIASQ